MRIEAKNLVKIYGDRSVVNDVSFNINKGEVVGLLGPNGAGKTTTFYMIVGLVKPHSGVVTIDGQEITNWPMHVRARAGIGYLPQEASSFRTLSVEDNIKLVLEMNSKLTEDEKKKKLEELLAEFGVAKLRKATAISLSGGELQVLILFCLMNRSRVLTRLLSVKLKTISENCLRIKGLEF